MTPEEIKAAMRGKSASEIATDGRNSYDSSLANPKPVPVSLNRDSSFRFVGAPVSSFEVEKQTVTLPGTKASFRPIGQDQLTAKADKITAPWPTYLKYKYHAADTQLVIDAMGAAAVEGRISFEDAKDKSDPIYLDFLKKNGRIRDAEFTEEPVKWFFGQAAELSASLVQGAAAMAKGAAQGAIAGGALSLAAPPLAPALMGGAIAVGANYGLARFTQKVTSGGVYMRLREAGVPHKQAQISAAAAGAITGLLELAQFSLLSPIKKGAAVKALANPTNKQIMAKLTQQYLEDLGANVSIEVAQTEAETLADNFARVYSGLGSDTEKELREQLADTLIKSAAGLGLFQAASMALGATPAAVRKIKERAAKSVEPTKPPTTVPEFADTKEAMKFGRDFGGAVKTLLDEKRAGVVEQLNTLMEKEQLTDKDRAQTSLLTSQLNEINAAISAADEARKGIGKKAMPMAPEAVTVTPITPMAREFANIINAKKINDAEYATLTGEYERAIGVGDRNAAKLAADKLDAMDRVQSELLLAKDADKTLSDSLAQNPVAAENLESYLDAAGALVEHSTYARLEQRVSELRQKAFELGVRRGANAALETARRVGRFLNAVVDASGLSAVEAKKLRAEINNIDTLDKLDTKYYDVLSRISEARGRTVSDIVRTKLKKEFKAAKPERTMPDTAKAAKALRGILRTSKKEAGLNVYDAFTKWQEAIADGDIDSAAEAHLAYLAYREKAGLNSPDETITFLNESERLLTEGKTEFRAALEKRKAEIQAKRDDVKKAIIGNLELAVPETGKPVSDYSLIKDRGIARKAIDEAGDMLSFTLDDMASLADKLSFYDITSRPGESALSNLVNTDDAFIAKINRTHEKRVELADMALRAYAGFDLTGKTKAEIADASKRAARVLYEEHIKPYDIAFTDTDGKVRTETWTRGEAISLYLQWQRPDLRETITETMKYGSDARDKIFGILTEQDRIYAGEVQEFFRRYWDEINPIYKELNFTDMAKNDLYFPAARVYKTDIDPLQKTQETFKKRITALPGSLMPATGSLLELERRNVNAVLYQHVLEIEHYLAYEKSLRDMQAVWDSAPIKEAVIGVHGKTAYQQMRNLMQGVAGGGGSRGLWGTATQKAISNLQLGAIALKPASGMKQFTSLVAFADDPRISALDFTRHLADFWKDPIGNWRVLADTPYFKERIGNLSQEIRDLQIKMQKEGKTDLSKYRHMQLMFTNAGDRMTIAWGGYAYYKSMLDMGVSPEEALKRAIIQADKTQQSGLPERLSNLQLSPGMRFAATFLGAQLQLMRRDALALRGAFSGRMPAKDIARSMAIYHMLYPAATALIGTWGLRKGEELADYTAEQAGQFIYGPFSDLPFIGSALMSLSKMSAHLALGTKPKGTFTPRDNFIERSLNDMVGALKVMMSDGPSTEEIFGAYLTALDIAGKVSTGMPVKTLYNEAEGMLKLSDDITREGLMQALGYPKMAIGVEKKSKFKPRIR